MHADLDLALFNDGLTDLVTDRLNLNRFGQTTTKESRHPLVTCSTINKTSVSYVSGN